jgi:hypothetical protein
MEKLPFFNAVSVFNSSLVSSVLVVASLVDRILAVCSCILPLADYIDKDYSHGQKRQKSFPSRNGIQQAWTYAPGGIEIDIIAPCSNTSNAGEKISMTKILRRWDCNEISTSAMTFRPSIPETNQGSRGAGMGRDNFPTRRFCEDGVELLVVNLERLLDHSLIVAVTQIICEIHQMNRPIRQSGSVHRSKHQDICRARARSHSF